MTPAARVQAAIEILDLVIAAARGNGPPADRVITEWFRTRRFAGSSDRRAVRELAYGAIRKCGEVPLSGRAAMLTWAREDVALTALFDGSPHAPAPIGEGERYARPGTAPAWLEKLLSASDVTGDLLGALRSTSASTASGRPARRSNCRSRVSRRWHSMACGCLSARRSSNGRRTRPG